MVFMKKINYLVSVVNHCLKYMYRHRSLGRCRANCAFPLVYSVLDSFLCEESDSACYIKAYWGSHHYHNWILGHILKASLSIH